MVVLSGIFPANWGMDHATDPTELRGTISTTIDVSMCFTWGPQNMRATNPPRPPDPENRIRCAVVEGYDRPEKDIIGEQ